MRHALTGPLVEQRSFSFGQIARRWHDFVRRWREDAAFAAYMSREFPRGLTGTADVEKARKAIDFAYAKVRSPSFHLNDFSLFQRNPPVHASRKVVIVRRDKGSEFRRAHNLR